MILNDKPKDRHISIQYDEDIFLLFLLMTTKDMENIQVIDIF